MNTSTEAVNTAETSNAKERSDSVDDAVIITAFLNAQNKKDSEGNIIGHLGDVVAETGMQEGSLSGRLTALRKLGVPLPKMGEEGALARKPSNGKTRKKSPSDVMALFNKISVDLANHTNDEDTTDEVADVADVETGEVYEDAS